MRPADWYHSPSIDGMPVYSFYPSDRLNRDLLRQGKTMAWNPYNGLGSPWLGAMQSAPYYPLKIISYILPYWLGADIVRLLMLLLAGWGTYLLLAALGTRWEAGLLGGVGYMFSQRLFVMVNMPTLNIESLLPMMLYAIVHVVRDRSITWVAVAGLIGGAQFLGGFPETSFIFAFCTAAFFLWLVLQPGNRSHWVGHLGHGVAVAALCLLISGFHLAEFVRYLKMSNHVHTEAYGLVVKEPFWLMSLFLPNFWGKPFRSSWAAGAPPHDHMNLSLFTGIATLLLALTALTDVRSSADRRHRWFFAGLLIFFIGYDYGFPVLRHVGRLPLFNLMSTAWNAFVIPFCIAVLAGFGLQTLLTRGDAWKRVSCGVGLYLLIALTLTDTLILPPRGNSAYWVPILRRWKAFAFVLPVFVFFVYLVLRRKHARVGALLMACLVVAEMYACLNRMPYLHHVSPIPEPPSLTWLKKNVLHERLLGLWGIYPANTLISSQLRDIRHLDAMYPERYVNYAEAIWPGAKGNVYVPHHGDWKRYESRLLDLAAVRYIVSPQPLDAIVPPSSAALQEPKFSQVYSDGAAYIYEKAGAFARARFVPEARRAPDGLTPADLEKTSLDLEKIVFLEGYSGEWQGLCDVSTSEGKERSTVEFIQDDPDRVRLRVLARCRGFLLLADAYYPGWKATVDGKPVPVYRANYVFRAVEVAEGTHEVAFTYSPINLVLGLPAAVISFLGALGLAFVTFMRPSHA